MKKIVFVIVVLSLVIGIPFSLFALDGIEFLSGYLKAEIKDKKHYKGVPLVVGLNFDAKPFFSKYGLKPKGDLNFVVEPFLNTIFKPDENIEFGTNFLVKYAYPLNDTFQPFFKVGGGLICMTQHTREQGTQFNFTPQLGGGFHYFVREDVALTVEYRYRHLSNAGMKEPNKGIDSQFILAGVSLFFE